MLKDLVHFILKSNADGSYLSLKIVETLKRDIQNDANAAFDLSLPLIQKHPILYKNSSSFVDFIFKICEIQFSSVAEICCDLQSNSDKDRIQKNNNELIQQNYQLKNDLDALREKNTELQGKLNNCLEERKRDIIAYNDLQTKFNNSYAEISNKYDKKNSEIHQLKKIEDFSHDSAEKTVRGLNDAKCILPIHLKKEEFSAEQATDPSGQNLVLKSEDGQQIPMVPKKENISCFSVCQNSILNNENKFCPMEPKKEDYRNDSIEPVDREDNKKYDIPEDIQRKMDVQSINHLPNFNFSNEIRELKTHLENKFDALDKTLNYESATVLPNVLSRLSKIETLLDRSQKSKEQLKTVLSTLTNIDQRLNLISQSETQLETIARRLKDIQEILNSKPNSSIDETAEKKIDVVDSKQYLNLQSAYDEENKLKLEYDNKTSCFTLIRSIVQRNHHDELKQKSLDEYVEENERNNRIIKQVKLALNKNYRLADLSRLVKILLDNSPLHIRFDLTTTHSDPDIENLRKLLFDNIKNLQANGQFSSNFPLMYFDLSVRIQDEGVDKIREKLFNLVYTNNPATIQEVQKVDDNFRKLETRAEISSIEESCRQRIFAKDDEINNLKKLVKKLNFEIDNCLEQLKAFRRPKIESMDYQEVSGNTDEIQQLKELYNNIILQLKNFVSSPEIKSEYPESDADTLLNIIQTQISSKDLNISQLTDSLDREKSEKNNCLQQWQELRNRINFELVQWMTSLTVVKQEKNNLELNEDPLRLIPSIKDQIETEFFKMEEKLNIRKNEYDALQNDNINLQKRLEEIQKTFNSNNSLFEQVTFELQNLTLILDNLKSSSVATKIEHEDNDLLTTELNTFLKRVKELAIENHKLKNYNNDLTTQLNEIQNAYSIKREEFEKLNEILDKTNSQLNIKTENVQNGADFDNIENRSEMETYKTDIFKRDIRIKQLETELKEINQKYEQRRQIINKLEKNLTKYKKLKHKDKKQSSIGQNMIRETSLYDELQIKTEKLNREPDNLSEPNPSLKREYEFEISNLKAQNFTYLNEIEELQEKYGKLSLQFTMKEKESTELAKLAEESNKRLNSVFEENNVFRERVRTLENDIQNQKKLVDEKEADLKQINKSTRDIISSNTDMKNQMLELSSELEKMKNEKEINDRELEELKREIYACYEENELRNEQMDRLKEEYKKDFERFNLSSKSDQDSKDYDISLLREEYKTKELELHDLKQQLLNQTLDLKNSNDKYSAVETQRQILFAKFEEFKNQYSDDLKKFENIHIMLNDTTYKFKELNDNLEQCKEENKNLKMQIQQFNNITPHVVGNHHELLTMDILKNLLYFALYKYFVIRVELNKYDFESVEIDTREEILHTKEKFKILKNIMKDNQFESESGKILLKYVDYDLALIANSGIRKLKEEYVYKDEFLKECMEEMKNYINNLFSMRHKTRRIGDKSETLKRKTARKSSELASKTINKSSDHRDRMETVDGSFDHVDKMEATEGSSNTTDKMENMEAVDGSSAVQYYSNDETENMETPS